MGDVKRIQIYCLNVKFEKNMKVIWIISLLILAIVTTLTGIWACNQYDSTICNITYKFLESNFILALIGSVFGASFGALAAQKISNISKQSDLILSEFKESNAATIVAISICNQALTTKKFFIQPIYDNYHEIKKIYRSDICVNKTKDEFQKDVSVPKIKMQLERSQLHLSPMPVDFLHNQIVGKVELSGQTLMTLFELVTVNRFFERVIESRNRYLSEFDTKFANQHNIDINEKLNILLGEPDSDENLKVELNESTDNMLLFIDKVIVFSYQLTQGLIKHNNELGLKYRKLGNKTPLSFHNADFSSSIAEGLIPEEALKSDQFNENQNSK